MILLFFLIPTIFAFSIVYLISYVKWLENKRIATLFTKRKHDLFENLKVSSISYGKLKSIMGFEVKARLFLIEDCLIITSERMNIKLFHTLLPVIIENKKGIISKVKMTSWNTIQIAFQKNTFSLGKATIEFTIETKDNAQQLEIYNLIKDWN